MLLQQWITAINTPNVKVVRLLAHPDEEEMVDTFFQYLLALDIDIDDFTMVFETSFNKIEDFSTDLLKEFEEDIDLWNSAEKPDTIPNDIISWKANYSIKNNNNVASTFTENMNTFATYAFPEKEAKVCLIIKMPNARDYEAYNWLESYLKSHTASHIILGITDSEDFPLFDKIAKKYPKEILTIRPNLNMDAAVEQLAAQTNHALAENSYRSFLVKLMNAVKKRDAKKTDHYSIECLKIATKELDKDLNWFAQIVTIYTILYNDQIGYKNYEDAIFFADKAVDAALLSIGNIDPEVAYRLVGQTHLGRGALHYISKNNDKALNNYITASHAYETCKDYLMQCEALRQAGDICKKNADDDNAITHYTKAYSLKAHLTPDVIKNSTFPYVVKALLKYTHKNPELSEQQLSDDLIPIFGENWKDVIYDYGNHKKVS